MSIIEAHKAQELQRSMEIICSLLSSRLCIFSSGTTLLISTASPSFFPSGVECQVSVPDAITEYF